MGNDLSRSQQINGQQLERDPLAKIDQMIKIEKKYMESMITSLKKEKSTVSVQTQLSQYQKLFETADFFYNKGGLFKVKQMQEQEENVVESQISESRQREYQLESSLKNKKTESEIQLKEIRNANVQQQKAIEEAQFLKIQIQSFEDDYSVETKKINQKLQDFQQKSSSQIKQLQMEQQQSQLAAQKQIDDWKQTSNPTINEINQQHSLLEKQLVEKQKQLKDLKEEIIKKQQKQQQLMEQIETQRKAKEIIKDAELSQAKTEEDLKAHLEILNPQQEISQSQVEFVKQFQVIQNEQLTVEEVQVIEDKHHQIEKQLVNQLKYDQKQSQDTYQSQNDTNNHQGCIGVLILYQMLAEQGIQTFLTDKSMKELEQSSKAVYQQKIIQCGIQDSSSYLTANYASSQIMEKQILDAQSLPNYIQNFKNDMAKQLGEKEITPLDIQVFAVTTQPPRVNFQINHDSAKKIKDKNFSSLGIDVETQNLLEKAELSIDMFDSKYNMTWDDLGSQIDYRGALEFYNQTTPTPQVYKYPKGYLGLGLKVLNRYGNDQKWIRSDTQPGTWIVLFHGTGHKSLKSILQNTILPGKRNVYGGDTCRITGTRIKKGDSQNTYLADDVLEAEPYSIDLNKKDNVNYSLVFQCRVNPKKVKSPYVCPEYYTVENPLDDIRPYRLLIKNTNN